MKRRAFYILGIMGIITLMISASSNVKADTDVLPANSYKAWYDTLYSGDTWLFSVQATDDVDVMVMDEDNYNIFNSGGTSYFVYTDYTEYNMLQYSFTITGLTGKIYIVVKSNNLLMDQTINYESAITRYTSPSTTPTSNDTSDDSETPGFELPLILISTVISVGLYSSVRRRK